MNKIELNTNKEKPFKYKSTPSHPFGPNLLEIVKNQFDVWNPSSNREANFSNELKPDSSDIEIRLSSNSDLLSLFRKRNNNSLNFDEGLSPINKEIDNSQPNFELYDDASEKYSVNGEINILEKINKKESSSSGIKSENNWNEAMNKIESDSIKTSPKQFLEKPRTILNDIIPKQKIKKGTNLIQLVRKKQENMIKDFSPIHEESSNFNYTFDQFAKGSFPGKSNIGSIEKISEVQSTSELQKTPRNKVVETSLINKSLNDDGHKVINQYILESELGRGAFGKVKLALSESDQKFYVLTFYKGNQNLQ